MILVLVQRYPTRRTKRRGWGTSWHHSYYSSKSWRWARRSSKRGSGGYRRIQRGNNGCFWALKGDNAKMRLFRIHLLIWGQRQWNSSRTRLPSHGDSAVYWKLWTPVSDTGVQIKIKILQHCRAIYCRLKSPLKWCTSPPTIGGLGVVPKFDVYSTPDPKPPLKGLDSHPNIRTIRSASVEFN